MLPRFHCITNSATLNGQPIEAVVDAGVDAIQVRAKNLTDRELLDLTAEVVARVADRAKVIVNDRLDVALAAGADGVHVGLDDLPVWHARRLAPAGFLVGGTCRHAEHARQVKAEGADYVGVGPIYLTTSKQGLPDPIGLHTLADVAKVLPAIAISGITLDRVPEVMRAGAYGVAVIAALAQADDPGAAAAEIAAAIRTHRWRTGDEEATTALAR
ncbi:thiamine phosphate synthase [Actinopolymorpha sp. B11F2]|uniref:thiamine phosphate synthase n=1 Tax=Actinopolymorpha sp. B11F2 TaxID=3160862 RepID=UPI0032E44BC4